MDFWLQNICTIKPATLNAMHHRNFHKVSNSITVCMFFSYNDNSSFNFLYLYMHSLSSRSWSCKLSLLQIPMALQLWMKIWRLLLSGVLLMNLFLHLSSSKIRHLRCLQFFDKFVSF